MTNLSANNLQLLRSARHCSVRTYHHKSPRSGWVISHARCRGRNSKFRFLEVPQRIKYICQVSSTLAQRSRSLRVLKMLTLHGHTEGRTFDQFYQRIRAFTTMRYINRLLLAYLLYLLFRSSWEKWLIKLTKNKQPASRYSSAVFWPNQHNLCTLAKSALKLCSPLPS